MEKLLNIALNILNLIVEIKIAYNYPKYSEKIKKEIITQY